jgi:hypothetical protein
LMLSADMPVYHLPPPEAEAEAVEAASMRADENHQRCPRWCGVVS